MMTQITYETCCTEAGKKPDVREQAMKNGFSTMTDKELVMILLGTGTKGIHVSDLSDEVLDTLETSLPYELSESLAAIPGMGPGKISTLLSAIELGKRIASKNSTRIKKPSDVIPFIQSYSLKQEEHFICIMLNSAHEILKIEVISKGILNQSLIHPREIFVAPITERAAAIILAHNHPSGNVMPSEPDFETTKIILDASRIIGIPLLDHIIITKTDYFSFKEQTDLFIKRKDSGA